MEKYTSLAILKEDHTKLKVISAKLGIGMIQLLHRWITNGCVCSDTNQPVQHISPPAMGSGLSFQNISDFHSPMPVIAHNPQISHKPTVSQKPTISPDLELFT